ncbi:DUF4411 family protein [bacterium]|nr:DUF4411 family protein [bacterium]
MKPPFLIDTSSFRVLSNYYQSQFPSFWKRFEEAVANGTIRSVKEVFAELEQYDTNWIYGKANILQGKPVADPFLIAAGYHSGGTVVTEESRKPKASKIPNVCDDFGIEVTNVEGMLEQLGWSF